MVCNALKIANQMQQLGRFHAVLFAHRLCGQMHKEGSQRVLIAVGVVFALPDRGGQFRRKAEHGLQAFVQRKFGVRRHALGQFLALDERNSRCCK